MPWNIKLEPLDERHNVDIEDLEANFDRYMADERYRWNLGPDGYRFMIAEYHEHSDG